jgi:hypothetical protein
VELCSDSHFDSARSGGICQTISRLVAPHSRSASDHGSNSAPGSNAYTADFGSRWFVEYGASLLHQHGFQFGRDIIFTYGPLGFLVAPTYFGQVPLFRVIWETCGNLALAATLVGIGGGFGWFRFGLYYISLVAALLIAPATSSHFTVPLLVSSGFCRQPPLLSRPQ